MKITILLLTALISMSCTEQQRAKKYGGTATENLPANQKLVTVTWKETNLWYLTRPMSATDVAETYEFKESSNFGILNGKVIIKETKTK